MTANKLVPPCDQNGDWVSIADLLYDGKPYQDEMLFDLCGPPQRFEIPHPINIQIHQIVSAIENEGIITFDKVDRPIEATNGDENDRLSKAYILNLLADYYVTIRGNPTDVELHNIDADYLDPEDGVFQCFGWYLNGLPDFDNLAYGEAESIQPSEEQEPAPNSIKNYNRLIRILASVADIDLDGPHKAAVALINHANTHDLPAPSKPETFSKN